MAAWIPANQKLKTRDFQRIEKDMGYILSPKPTINLMQNCDLPPPVKLFSGPDETIFSSISRICSSMEGRDQEAKEDEQQVHLYEDCSVNDKLEILKALRLSQTRAREAERKLGVLIKEKEDLSRMIVDDSLRLFAYRQWVNLLEFQVLKLEKQQHEENRESGYGVLNCAEKTKKEEDCDEGSSANNWSVAIVLGLAIVGMGFALGCKYFF